MSRDAQNSQELFVKAYQDWQAALSAHLQASNLQVRADSAVRVGKTRRQFDVVAAYHAAMLVEEQKNKELPR